MGKLKKHLNDVINPTWNASGRCKTRDDETVNAVLGLVGEAGEVADTLKKAKFHKPKDYRDELKLELGDVIYYWLKVVDLEGFSIDEILNANQEKLFDRYEIKHGQPKV